MKRNPFGIIFFAAVVAILQGCSSLQPADAPEVVTVAKTARGPNIAPEFDPTASTAATETDDGGAVEWFSSPNCASQPSSDRVFGAQEVLRNTNKYTWVTRGNEVSIYDSTPWRFVDSSYFNVPNVGDSDYDLMNVAVCDQCRFGAAVYKAGLVLFDLWYGIDPEFYDHEYYPGVSQSVEGAFTYKAPDGTQYLVAAGLGADCGGGSAIYEFDDIGIPDSDEFVECVTVPGRIPQIVNGRNVYGYAYLIDRDTWVHIFEIQESGPLTYVQTPFTGYGIKAASFSFWGEQMINKGKIYSLSNVPWPVEVGEIPQCFDDNRSALKGDLAFFGRKGFKNSESTWDISNPAVPVEVQADYWDSANPWNYPGPGCANFQDAMFMIGRPELVMLRFGKGQRIDVDGWLTPTDFIFADGFETGNTSRWSETIN